MHFTLNMLIISAQFFEVLLANLVEKFKTVFCTL